MRTRMDAGHRVYREDPEAATNANNSLQQEITELRQALAQLESQKATELGLSIKCQSIKCVVRDNGITIAASITSLTNGNTSPASIETRFCAPFILGGLRAIASTRALSHPIPEVTPEVPLLEPSINLDGKHSVLGIFSFTSRESI